ncbi:MAG TPA: 2-isopropylmalate synthase [Chloroflexota bacterium]|jgi:2-isopropylmalate synthase|nr:2-isopropylmalate synthase [Chloroflexota bacterium]
MDRVIIFDTTLRDGEQSPGASLTVEEKVDIAHQLERLGVDVIEAGFPISSPGDFQAVQRIAREVRGATICGLARAVPADVDRAYEALKDAEDPRIHVFISSSDIHMAHQIRKGRGEILELTGAMVRRAKGYVSNVEFSPMDATRSDREFLVEILRVAIEAGATTLNIPDTVGYAMPEEFGDLIAYLIEHVPGAEKVVFSAHCHDDLGLAVANSLAAVRRGARQVECTINGIGERAGNCSLEEVVMALRTRSEYFGIDTRIDTTQLYQTSRMVSNYTGIIVQPNKAVVGANAFAHASGIHQDGILKERTTFEIMDPRDVGLRGSTLVLGKLSGRHAFKARLEELGYHLSPEDLNRAFARFKELADKKKVVTDEDLAMIVSDEVRSPAEIYRLDFVQVTCGDHSIPTATVRLIGPDGVALCDSSTGTGPVDAVYKAVNRLIKVENRLIEYSVQSVTAGLDAIGEVTIRIEADGRIFGGRGADTDIIVASTRAYVNALNKLIAARQAAAVGR